MAFKDILKKQRRQAGLTQKELAIKSNVSYSYITKLESGEADNPTYEIIEVLSKVLNAPLGAIYDFADEPADKAVTMVKDGLDYSDLPPEGQKELKNYHAYLIEKYKK